MIDLPLKGAPAHLRASPREPENGLEAAPAGTRSPRPSKAAGSKPVFSAVVACALASGALAGWFLKPDPALPVLSSKLVDFGEIRLASTSEGTALEITNAGERSLSVSRVFLDGERSAEFALVEDSCTGRRLAAREACTLAVEFSPSGTGLRRAWLQVEGEALEAPPHVPLLGFGVAPQLEAEPLRIDFGEHLIGNSSQRSILRVANRGSAPITIQSAELEGPGAGDFGVRDLCSGQTVAPGERCTMAYAFLPTVAEERRAVVRLKSDTGDALAASPELLGRGLPRQATLSFEPRRLEFEPRLAGSASPSKKVTLTNAGTAPLALRRLAIRSGGSDSPASGFELRPGQCGRGPLQPGKSCTAEVLFRPDKEGPFNADLEILHGAGGAPRRIPLAGAGTAPEIFLDPLVLDFSQVAVGRVSDSKFLRVVNSGTGPLEIAEIRLRGAGAQAFTARPVGCTTAPIKPKSSCGVEVRFKPHRGGAFHAEVVLRHSAPGQTSRIELRGLGQVR